MKVLSLFTTTALLSAVGLSSADEPGFVYGKDPKKDAEYDISMGMAGIQNAAKDPKMLAQLFQDMQVSFWCWVFAWQREDASIGAGPMTWSIATFVPKKDSDSYTFRFTYALTHQIISFYTQDPELMAEAKKMMESAEWKKKMKGLANDKAFKNNIDNVKKTMEDPNEAAKMQAKMEHMMKVGQGEIENEAKDTMATAMQAMADPNIMAEAARMMKDPNFQQQLSQMAKDPSFKKYVNAMQDMMQDPATKREMEQMADSFKSAL